MYRYNTIQYEVEAGLMKPFYVLYLRINHRLTVILSCQIIFFLIMVKITSNSRLLILNCTNSWVRSFCHSWKGERNWEVWDGGFWAVALWEEEVSSIWVELGKW